MENGLTSRQIDRDKWTERQTEQETHYREHSFIHSDHFYSASSSPLPLRGAPDTARILCWNFTPKRHRPLWVRTCPRSLRGSS